MNIPIYRAKKIDSDEYVIGYLYYCIIANTYYIQYSKIRKGLRKGKLISIEIDSTTLAIHFPDMLDSEDNPIFASLSENGSGGDKAEYIGAWSGLKKESNIIFKNGCIWLDGERCKASFLKQHNLKVIGIQK